VHVRINKNKLLKKTLSIELKTDRKRNENKPKSNRVKRIGKNGT